MKVKINELQRLMHQILTSRYFTSPEAKDIVEVLLYAEISGKKTQGIIKFLGTEPIQDIKPLYKPKIIKETQSSVFIDGGHNPGMLVAKMATELAITKCSQNGFAIIGANNSYSSTGAIGYYANEIAKHDLIGIVMSGTPKAVAPYGSIDRLIGINPIAFGFPTENDPLVFDIATAAITWYGLVKAKIMGQKLPEGVAVDELGNPTKDPEKAMKGALLTFGENRKMSGLSIVIELFTGALVGAIDSDTDGKWYSGNLFIAIDPNLFIGREKLKKNSTLLINKIKKSRPSSEYEKVIIPGEMALKSRKDAEAKGIVEVDVKVYSEMLLLTKKLEK